MPAPLPAFASNTACCIARRARRPAAGFTYELCAGIVDKPGLNLKQITQEEVRRWMHSADVATLALPCPLVGAARW